MRVPSQCRHWLDRLPASLWSKFAASLLAFIGLAAGGRVAGPRGAFIGVVAGAVLGCLIGPAVRQWGRLRPRPAGESNADAVGAVGATAGAVVGAAAGAAAGPAGLVAGASVGSVAGDRMLRGAAHCEDPNANDRQATDDMRAGIGSAGGAVLGAVVGSVAGPLGAVAGTKVGAAAGEVVGRGDREAGNDGAPGPG